MTPDVDSTLNFKYVDISSNMGGQTKGFSAMSVFGDRVYMGFPDSGGKRPYLVSLINAPGLADDGIDTSQNSNNGTACNPATHDSCYLAAVKMPDIGKDGGNSAGTIIIDFISSFSDRLYIGNNGGLVRSTTNAPLDYTNSPGDWEAVTPSSADYTAKTSVTTTKTAEIEPVDKAWPQVAEFNGHYFAARNTTDGPQLWRCDPEVESGPAPATAGDCDEGDWSLVAANGTGDALLTQFDNANNTSIGFLVANGDYLYVGFNNATDGVIVFRTDDAEPSSQNDFEGDGACMAPCAGLGGNGLGDAASNQMFFAAVSLVFGSTDYLYITAGDGTNAVSVFRTSN